LFHVAGRGIVFIVGNVKSRAKAAVMRHEATRMNREGLSNEVIATKLGVHVVTVVRYLNEFLNSEDCRYPSTLTADAVETMRAQEREHIESNQRYILQRLLRLHQLKPKNNEEECKISDAMCRGIDAFSRASERKSKLFGLDPKPEPNTVTNNTLALAISSTYTQQDAMRDLAIINAKR
jgi:transposase